MLKHVERVENPKYYWQYFVLGFWSIRDGLIMVLSGGRYFADSTFHYMFSNKWLG